MQFYNREKETRRLQEIMHLAYTNHSRMTIVTGRRRIGKTLLIKNAFKDTTLLYFFIGRKSEGSLVNEFRQHIVEVLGGYVPKTFSSFSDIMRFLFEIGKTKKFTIIIDEFQEFYTINPSVFSDLQNIWDSYKQQTKINLVISGSVYSLMEKIFTDNKEPLFNRADTYIKLRPFDIEVLKNILKDFTPNYTNDDLLCVYTITGGVPKYVELLCDNNCLTVKKIYSYVFGENSPFIDEGRNILISEFGRNYNIYFSILQEIANGKRTQSEIEFVLGNISIGGHLAKLETVYNLIQRERPIFSKPMAKNVIRYVIRDNFLNFWFRYFEKYSSYIELQNFEDLRTLAYNDYPTYSGKMLENYFKDRFMQQGGFKEIGSWWNNKKSSNNDEIDIVALYSQNNKALVCEVKRKEENYNHKKFMEKVEHLRQKEMFDYEITTNLLTLKDM